MVFTSMLSLFASCLGFGYHRKEIIPLCVSEQHLQIARKPKLVAVIIDLGCGLKISYQLLNGRVRYRQKGDRPNLFWVGFRISLHSFAKGHFRKLARVIFVGHAISAF